MKNLFVAAFVFGLAFCSKAQKEENVKELGFSFSNLDDFNMVYRFGNETSLWRVSFLNARLNFQPEGSSDRENFNAGLGLRLGKEWRKSLSPKFKLRYGSDISANLSLSNSNFDESSYTKSLAYRFGVLGVFGFNYELGKGLIFGAELLPSLGYNGSEAKRKIGELNQEEVSNSSQVNFGLDNSLELSLVYQF